MKALLLATALVAAPLIAQTAPEPTPQTQPTGDRATTPTESAPTEPGQPAPGAVPAEGANATAADQVPASQVPAPPAAPGGVVFQQPPSVEQAFPPPAAKESYPVCSKTVTDGCRQRRDPK